MFVRVKRAGPDKCLQIVRNRREGKKVRQTVVATLGQLLYAIRIPSCLWLLARNRKAGGTGAARCWPLAHGNLDKWRPEHNLAKSMWNGIHR